MKKDFAELLEATKPAQKAPAQTTVTTTPEVINTAQMMKEIRVTLTMPEDLKANVDKAAYIMTGQTGRRVLIKDVIADALREYLDRHGMNK